jgi:hypothetical protein
MCFVSGWHREDYSFNREEGPGWVYGLVLYNIINGNTFIKVINFT